MAIGESEANTCRAQNLVDSTWRRLADGFMSRITEGRSVEGFPDLSEAAAQRMASEARTSLATIDAVDLDALPHQLALTLKVVRFQASIEAQAADRYWLAQDYGTEASLFPIGAYGGRYLSIHAQRAFTAFQFRLPGDCDRYLALLEDYVHLLTQVHEKLVGQAARGIRIPQPAIAGMRSLVGAQAEAAREALTIDSSRGGEIRLPSGFLDGVRRRIEERVMPAFSRLAAEIGDDYAMRAPEAVGMSRCEGGRQIYEALVAEHLTMPMTVDQVHREGHDRMAAIEGEMELIRSSLGYGSRDDFHRYLLTGTWIAGSDRDLQVRFDEAIRKIEPALREWFNFMPAAGCRAARLDPRFEAGMTYGYFQPPDALHPEGIYYFNASNLAERTLATAPSLAYHELLPGHHLHLASQRENELLHPLRQSLFFTAFTEGWAEYAATLAGEMGMYADPRERYGRLLMDAFLTSRLVVDTGMNALGWSLERAREYMRSHTMMSQAEVRSEALRYSTDVPAKALAYKIGEIKFHELRRRAHSVLGGRFDIRDFHDAILGSGGMPLEVLDWHVGTWIDAARR
jgi:uncharacterized protein (DUF885 family)